MLRLVAQQCSNSRVITTCFTQQRPTTVIGTTTITKRIPYNQNRLFATKRKSKPKTECPFQLLGVPTESKYSKVKSAFLKLAMTTHPDVVPDEQKKSAEETFIQIRMAFERIRPLENGMATLVLDDSNSESDEHSNRMTSDEAVQDFNDWFYSETGKRAPIGSVQLDRETIQEVKFVYEKQVPGGLDKGGMWHLAGMIANSVEDDVVGGIPKKLGVGDAEEDVVVRSRRRRRR